jgi:hypothetical protein
MEMPAAGPQVPGWTGFAPVSADEAAAEGGLLLAARDADGKWVRKSTGKDGKFIMIICLE